MLFINTPIPEISKKIIEKYRVTAIPFAMSDLPAYMASFHPSTYRWYLIQQFLQKPENQNYRRVWMIDVRDSFFQSDPFKMIEEGTSQFYTFKGVEMAIGQCGWNGPWVSDCFGKEVELYYFLP